MTRADNITARSVTWAGLVLLLAWLAPGLACADDSARADVLFNEGRAHLASGDYAAACPLLEQSYALDPATGSLLALALCREGAGKPSAALTAYREVLTRSEAEGRADRARAARAKIEALEKATASLRIDASAVAALPGLQLTLNAEPVALPQLAQALPTDPGTLCLEASAPEKLTWRACVDAVAGSAHTLTIPVLEPVPASAPVAAAPAKPRSSAVNVQAARADSGDIRRPPAEWAGIALLSAGGAAFVTSIGFVLRASHQGSIANDACIDMCTPEGQTALDAEQRARDGALISGMVGLGAAVTGVVTYVWGRSMRDRSPRHASVTPAVSPTLAGLHVAGQF